MVKYFRFLVYLTLLWIPSLAFTNETPVTISVIAEEETIQPGKPFWIAIQIDLEDEWHTYWKNPGETGMPLAINWTIPKDFEVTALQWPTPKRFNDSAIIGYGYEKQATLLAQLSPPNTLKPHQTVDIQADVTWLACSSSTCLPGKSSGKLSLTSANEAPVSAEKWVSLFAQARQQSPQHEAAFEIKRLNGMLHIKLPEKEPFQGKSWSADFYPEEQDHINVETPPSISENTIALNEKQANKTTLRGILILNENNENNPQQHAFDIDLPIEDSSMIAFNDAIVKPISTEMTSHEFEGGLGLALLFAFLGGAILNLMPCVLPVISFKVMSFMKMAGESRSLVFKHGLSFSLGVILSFWVLAGAMLLLQTYGKAVGWGFQLQEPLFVAFLATLLLIVGLNMFGVFEAGLGIASWAGEAENHSSKKSEGLLSSFMGGILATAIATPCTGPFLGSAIGFAFTLPAIQAFLIFTVLGLGMSFPYLLLSLFPSCLRFMPKPGSWMVTFKELVGFVMLATVLWLVWIFGAQTSNISIMLLLFAFLFIALACWIYGKWSTPLTHRLAKAVAYASILVLLGLSGLAIVTAASSVDETENNIAMADDHQPRSIKAWETFSPERVAELQKQGIPVLVDFTAKWCLICQANHLVFSQESVSNKMAEKGVVKMKADWTKNDAVITKELQKFGRNGVPLYILYGTDPSQPPQILPQVLTTDIINTHLDAI